MSKYLVYGLIDPRTRLIRYVGRSSSGLDRPRAHGAPATLARETNYCANWIRELQSAGFNYDITVLEVVEQSALNDAEVWWIAYGRASGWPLTNLTNGGEGASGYVYTPELRERRRRDATGRTHTPEVRARLSRRAVDRYSDPSVRAKKVAELRAWNAKPENRRLRAMRMADGLTPEVRARIGDNTRRAWVNMSTDMRVRISEERRARRLGRRASDETKAKQSARAKTRELRHKVRAYMKLGAL